MARDRLEDEWLDLIYVSNESRACKSTHISISTTLIALEIIEKNILKIEQHLCRHVTARDSTWFVMWSLNFFLMFKIDDEISLTTSTTTCQRQRDRDFKFDRFTQSSRVWDARLLLRMLFFKKKNLYWIWHYMMIHARFYSLQERLRLDISFLSLNNFSFNLEFLFQQEYNVYYR